MCEADDPGQKKKKNAKRHALSELAHENDTNQLFGDGQSKASAVNEHCATSSSLPKFCHHSVDVSTFDATSAKLNASDNNNNNNNNS